MKVVPANGVLEMNFNAHGTYADPFNEIELDVLFADPEGNQKRVPAFWAGGNTWRVRYASPITGRHHYRTDCSDTGDAGLHGVEGNVDVQPYDGDNPLFKHGPLRVSANRRYLEHHDDTPFFWLGDTWWMGLTRRCEWPEAFQGLAADRVEKGFSVIQIVAGLYPDMGAFDERAANISGQAWEPGWTRIRPAFFDEADHKIACLVESGLAPCIVGCWGYYMEFCGPKVLKKHWRYLVARWGAYPVVWCNSGETLMPWYLHSFADDKDRQQWHAETREQWLDVTRYLRSVDPWHRPVTSHPGGRGSREMMSDDVVDIEMLQTGHGGYNSLANTVIQVSESAAQEPRMPVINGEVSYEGIGGTCWQDVQRLMFWTCMLNGAAGHTYGANGLWQMSSESEPYGPSPHGMSWGDTPWQAAAQLAGSRDVGIGRRILERYDWWRLEPTPAMVAERWTPDNYLGAYAATIPGQCHIIYRPLSWGSVRVKLEAGTAYRAFYVHPATGNDYAVGDVIPEPDGNWTIPSRLPVYHDLVLIIERVAS